MQVTPKTELEIEAEALWQEGTYNFEIIRAEPHTSSAGKESICLSIKITNGGNWTWVTDYVNQNGRFNSLKFLHLVKACDLMDSYNAGNVKPHEFKGKIGELSLIIQKSKDPQYSDRNAVKDYICKTEASSMPMKSLSDPLIPDDEIPF